MSSAEFLVFYATVCASILVLAWWSVAAADDSLSAGRESLPKEFAPQEIAFLRGDANELVRFAVFDLTYKGFLEVVPAERKREPLIRRTANVPDPAALEPAERIVYDALATPQTAAALFRTKVPELVGQTFAPVRERLLARRLLTAQGVRAAGGRAFALGSAAIVGIGAYRVWYALSLHHRNIGFTLVMAFVAWVLLIVVTRVRRVSARGRAYLQSLQAALPASQWHAAAKLSPAFPVVVAAGGMAVLAGTPYAALSETFKRQATLASTSATCSSGCGSSGGSSSGGSDGGGSSGCGGGCGGGA